MAAHARQHGVEAFVRNVYADVLQKEEADLDASRSFLSLGGDSLLAVFVVARCREAGFDVSPADVFRNGSIAHLSQQIGAQDSSASNTAAARTATSTEGGHDMPLTALQATYVAARWTQTRHWALPRCYSQEHIRAALVQLARRHGMLRARFFQAKHGGMAQKVVPKPERAFAWELRAQGTRAEREATAQSLAKSLGRAGSPVFGAVLFGTKEAVSHVALLAHRAAVDVPSWTLLLRELGALLAGHVLPDAPTGDFFAWARQAQDATRAAAAGAPPHGEQERFATIAIAEPTTSAALVDASCHAALRTTAGDCICAALQSALKDRFPAGVPFCVLGDAVREHDTAAWNEVVGCFDCVRVVRTAQQEADEVAAVRRWKDARRPPKTRDPTTFTSQPILIDLARLPQRAHHAQQQSDHVDALRLAYGDYDMCISAETVDGHLRTTFHAAASLYSQAAVDTVARAFEHALKRITAALTRADVAATLSDFPSMQWSYAELDRFGKNDLRRISANWVDEVEAVYPCSTIQEKVLLGQAVDPGAYQCSFSVNISHANGVDLATLASIWNETVSTISVLRTIFVEAQHAKGQYAQVVMKQIQPDIVLRDARDTPAFEFKPKHNISPFGQLRAPHRLLAIHTTATEAIATLEISHALIDGHSAELLLQRLSAAYLGLQPTMESLAYSKFVEYQHSRDDFDSSSHWRKYLTQATPSHVPVTTDQPVFKDLKTLHFALDVGSASSVDLRDTHHFTLANACQVAWGLVLRLLTGKDSVSFSFISAARHLPLQGIMEAIGPYMTTLICNLALPENAAVTDLLRQAGDDFQSYVQDQKEFPVHVSARSFGNSVLSFRRKLGQHKATSGLEVEIVDAYSPTDYDLSFVIQADEKTLDVSMDFWTSRISESYGRVLLATFREALQNVLQSPHGLVCDMNLVPKGHLLQTLEWNQDIPPAAEACVFDLVYATARQQPQAFAVDAWDGRLTYERLTSHASQLAGRLMDQGVGPETTVGLCMSKSRWGVVTMLAILQAGAVVVPLGIEHPIARIQTILADSTPALVLVDEAQRKRLSGIASDMMVVDASWFEPTKTGEPSSCRICPTVQPRNAAWIVYTSGSTGKPKGVVLEHRALSSSMQAHGKHFQLGTHSRVFQFSNYTFDAAIQENITTLVFGGCVCVPSESDRLNSLSQAISSLDVNFLGLTSSTAAVLQPEKLPKVETLVLFGEPLQANVVESWLSHARILNGYGPTECSIFSSVSAPLVSLSDLSTIGYPSGCNFWIVDPLSNCTRLCPIGVPGELLIEGPIVGRGYLNDVDKTDTSFIVNPGFVHALPEGANLGRRMYRTGDIVQQHSDGALTYFGRRDTMVKLRGQRLDVSEVEYWIAKLRDDITSVVVDLPVKQQQLVAAVTFATGSFVREDGSNANGLLPPSPVLQEAFSGLQKSLAEKLPSYMVPSVFVPLSKMPLTISSKTDRRAVLALLDAIPPSETRFYLKSPQASLLKPATDTERLLQALWAKTLSVAHDDIGLHDHFLHLGGDSIAAVRLVQEAHAVSLPLKVSDILNTPRLADLAALVDAQRDVMGEVFAEKDPAPFALWRDGLSNDVDYTQQLQTIAAQVGLPVDEVEDVFPCTPLQEALMAITTQNATAYISRQVFELDSTIKLAKLRNAWEILAASAPILRSRILLGRETVQVVKKGFLDWSEGENLDEYLVQDRERGISAKESLMRLAFIHDSATDKHFLVWTAHHSAYDGWSADLMYQYVIDIYRGMQPPPIAPYARFLKHVVTLDREDAMRYWGEQLEGANVASFPSLPNQHYRPKPTSKRQQTVPSMPKMQFGFSSAAVLQGAWAIVIAHYTGMEETIFSSTVTGRSAPVTGVASMIAPTIATVPVRVRICQTDGVRDFLAAVHEQAVAMIPYEQTGMQTIKDLLPDVGSTLDINNHFLVQPAVDKHRMKTFQGMCLIEDNQSKDVFDYSALTVECQLEAEGEETGATAHARFDSVVISEARVEAILRQFAHVVGELSRAAQAGNRPLSELNQLNAHDAKWIQAANTVPPAPVRSCIHHLIEVMVEKQPMAEAVTAWDGTLTYAEMNEQAKKLASCLVRTARIGPDKMVGLCMDKSKYAIVAMIAILHAGGAVVGINVQNPLDRIQTMMEDCGAVAILTDKSQMSRLDGIVPHVIPVKETLEICDQSMPTGPVCTGVGPQHAAWVIYTSGSTGAPKGVVLEHSALCSALLAHGRLFHMKSTSRVFQFATHSFDAAIQEVCCTMMYGGAVCVPSEDDRMSIQGLHTSITTMKVDTLGLTSTTAALLQPRTLPSVNLLILFGEALKASVVEAWIPCAEVLNAYGPSECCIHATCGLPIQCVKDTPVIGFPIWGCVWVADVQNYNKLAPIGGVGELLLEGPQLARGYLNDKVKTDLAFVEDPAFVARLGLQHDGPRRMYRTGDLVRQELNGQLTYLNRRDTQVKVNGQRLDVGEIEYWVRKLLPGVRHSVVDLTTVQAGAKPALVAALDFEDSCPYSEGVVQADSGVFEASAVFQDVLTRLRKRLREKLPTYMVPTFFVPVANIPLTTTGKTDRRQTKQKLSAVTPAQMRTYLVEAAAKEAPTTATELALRELWAKVLVMEVDAIGPEDNFLGLGGDSVRAIRLVEDARRIDLHITSALVFQHPRLCDLANQIDAQRADPSAQGADDVPRFGLWAVGEERDARLEAIARACAILPAQIEDVYPSTPLQEALLAATLRRPNAYVSRRTFALGDEIYAGRLHDAWQAVAKAAPVLRTRLLPQSKGGALQVVVSGPVHWSDATDLAAYLANDVAAGMQQGKPLVRCTIVREARGARFFVWTAHHSVYDGWSLQLLYRQVAAVYRDGDLPRAIPHTRFLRYLQQVDPEAARGFWLGSLHGNHVPACIPRLGYRQTGPKAPQQLHRRLKFDTTPLVRLKASLSNILRAAWALVLSQYTATDDVLFAVTVSGRSAPVRDITDMVAPTIATVPIRMQIDKAAGVGDFVSMVQQQSVDMMAYEHTGIHGIKKLAPELTPLLDLHHLFVVQPAVEQESALSFPGLTPVEDVSMAAFHDMPFVLECDLPGQDEEDLVVCATFDEGAVSVFDTENMVRQLEHVLCEFSLAAAQDPNRPLLSLKTINAHDSVFLRELAAVPVLVPGSGATEEPPAFKYWVTDVVDCNRLCPVGASGELVIDESDIPLEYLRNNLSETDFVTDPGFMKQLSMPTGRRMYRTGVLVRQTAASSFIHVGHRDEHISTRKERLPTPATRHSMSESKAVETAAESSLRDLWADILDVAPSSIGREDNFFDIGGDSIAAMRLVEAASQHAMTLTIKSVFRAPQLAAMAETITKEAAPASEKRAVYDPFSLLPLSDLETAGAEIESQLPESTSTQPFSILDILPATDPQAINVAGALLKSQVEVHYFQIEGQGQITPGRLREICQALAQQIEIFRTVYAFLENNLMQVVLSDYDAPIRIVRSYIDLDALTARLIRENKERPFVLGRPLIEMTVLTRPRHQTYRILFRMSHAVYDGTSFPFLWRTLQSLFDSTPSQPPSDFSSYTYDLCSRVTPESLAYWQHHLAGSTMPRLSPLRSSPNQTPLPMAFCGPKSIFRARTIPNGITSAIAVKSAWALVLGAYLGTQDVVFGDTIPGRSSTAHLSTIGCLATHVPLRVDLAAQPTANDLLLSIQDLLSSRLPYEAPGFREIWEKCTNWATGTRFTSIVNHRRAMAAGLEMGGTTHTVKTVMPGDMTMPNLYDIALVSEESEEKMELNLGYSKGVFTRDQAEVVLDLVCETITLFDQKSHTSIQHVLTTMAAKLPALHPTLVQPGTTLVPTNNNTSIIPIDPELEAIWHAVFDKKRGVPGAQFESSPFWDLGGDLQDAVLVAEYLKRRGMDVSVDDVLEKSSLETVAGLWGVRAP